MTLGSPQFLRTEPDTGMPFRLADLLSPQAEAVLAFLFGFLCCSPTGDPRGDELRRTERPCRGDPAPRAMSGCFVERPAVLSGSIAGDPALPFDAHGGVHRRRGP